MATWRQRVSALLTEAESKWSLWQLFQGTGLVASFGIGAWATKAADLFAAYAPLSWVLVGFGTALLAASIYLVWQFGFSLKVRAKYDDRFMEHGGNFNPLDKIFESRRIFLNDFALPSHPIIEGKTFVDCDIIGPANVYWHFNNQAQPIRAPIIDAICLDPDAKFTNGFIFQNCIFRNCSFQRITVFAGVEYYADWKRNNILNIISVSPSDEQIERRRNMMAGNVQPQISAPKDDAAEPILIEAEGSLSDEKK